MSKRDFKESYNKSISLLCLAITAIYSLNTYMPKSDSARKRNPIYNPVYVEVAKENDPSYIVEFEGDKGYQEFLDSHRLQILPKNGDKLIINSDNTITFSRIGGKKSLALGVPIGINSAGPGDLEALPGIGPKLAQKIILYRKSNGTFREISDLKKIDGIGEKRFRSVSKLVSLD